MHLFSGTVAVLFSKVRPNWGVAYELASLPYMVSVIHIRKIINIKKIVQFQCGISYARFLGALKRNSYSYGKIVLFFYAILCLHSALRNVTPLINEKTLIDLFYLNPLSSSAYYYYCGQNAKSLLSRDNKSDILGHLSECMGRRKCSRC